MARQRRWPSRARQTEFLQEDQKISRGALDTTTGLDRTILKATLNPSRAISMTELTAVRLIYTRAPLSKSPSMGQLPSRMAMTSSQPLKIWRYQWWIFWTIFPCEQATNGNGTHPWVRFTKVWETFWRAREWTYSGHEVFPSDTVQCFHTIK